MKITKTINFNVLVAALFVSLLSFNAVSADKFKKNSQELMIKVDSRGCAIDVELVSPQDNCAGSSWANKCGKNGKDCVCITNQKFITWKTSNGSRFELKFNDAEPFKKKCNFKSRNKKRIKCKINSANGDFIYDVVVESCPDQTYDPRIVVRT
jgi:cellobiose-specific phosphotransferase system component IIB